MDKTYELQVEKSALRKLLRLRRRGFAAATGPAALHLHAIVMARIALAQIDEGAQSVAAYLAAGVEVDALPLIELAAAAGMTTALPFIDRRGGTMCFRTWRPGQALAAGPYGVPQPLETAPETAPDTIFAPLVGFDHQGRRLGQGGGFYDRAFARFPDARRIGLAWSVQQAQTLPVEPWDLPVHGVVTEKQWIDCA